MKKTFLAVVLCCAGSIWSWGAEKSSEESYPQGQVKEIHIGIQRGTINIVSAQGPVKLEILRLDHMDKCDISTTVKNGTLRVLAKTKGWLWSHGNLGDGDGIKIPYHEKSACAVSVTVQAPPNLPLRIAGSYADIAVGKRNGSAKFSLAYGKLSLNGVKQKLQIDGISNIVDGAADSQDARINSVGGILRLTWSESSLPIDGVEISEVNSDNILEFPKGSNVEIEKSGWVRVLNQFAGNETESAKGNRTVRVQVSGVKGTLKIAQLKRRGKDLSSRPQAPIEKNTAQAAKHSGSVSDREKFTGSHLAIESIDEDITLDMGKSGEIRYGLSCVPNKSGIFLFGEGLWTTSQSTLNKERDENKADFYSKQGRLVIHSGKHWSCKANIHIPEKVSVALDGVSGDIQILRRSGETRVVSVSGDVKIQDSKGAVRVETASGDIKIKDSNGPIQAKSTSGDIEIIGGMKGVIAKAVSGDISISGSGPQTLARSISGDITFSPWALKSSQCIEDHTGTGDLKMSRPWKICKNSSVRFQTTSGDITIK